MTVPKPLLEILVCPKCKGDLEHRPAADAASQEEVLRCNQCRLDYPVRDGIPIMLIEEARVVT